MNALDLLKEAKHRGLAVPFVIITGKGDEGAAVAALKLGAYDYIVKRDNYLTQLPHAIDNAMAPSQLAQINRRLQTELAERERAQEENARLLVEVLGERQRLDEIIASAKVFKHLLGEDIELLTILDPQLGLVKADAGQMDQVILNLAVNARDAMPQGGKLTLETRNVILDEDYAQQHLSVESGSYVVLAISDTGCGMDAETLSHIFEPFFTTKEQGRGTGLGLSTVYGIISQSGGSIWVHSEPGRGTTFKIYLPRIEEPVAKSEETRAEPESPRGTETLLVVEDDELVRKLTCQVLRYYGYQVVEAANGGEALLACERLQGPISLMITDVVMPHMSGRELADRLHQLHPEMGVLFMSGYTDDAVIRHGLLDTAMFFLQKPFTPSALAIKVREVLDQ